MFSEFPRNDFINEAIKQGHSQEFINECLLYADNLTYKGLPVIFSTKHFCELLNISFKQLNYIMDNRGDFYGTFNLRKKRGGYRRIQYPLPILKNIQRWILDYILTRVPLHSSCKGFRRGESILTNATPHLTKKTILHLDIEDYFGSITQKQVFNLFSNLGYNKSLAYDLSKLCTAHKVETVAFLATDQKEFLESIKRYNQKENTDFILPQGAPTSPTLANLVSVRLDKRLFALAEKLGVTYTRYADDLTFSTDTEILPRLAIIKKILTEEGFQLNKSKTSTRKQGQRQIVTGLLVSGEKAKVPKKYKQDILKHLFYADKYGPKDHSMKIQKNPATFQEWILGRIMFVRSIELETGNMMLEKYNQIEWGFNLK